MARRKQPKKGKKLASADNNMTDSGLGDDKKKAKPSVLKGFDWKKLVAIVLVGTMVALYMYSLIEGDEGKTPETKSLQESSSTTEENKNEMPPIRVYKHFALLEILPHDPKAFTQGLTYGNNKLWEGTGLYGKSEIRHINPATGDSYSSTSLDAKYFGEGITYYEHPKEKRLIQLSWREKTGWIYNCDTFELDSEFTYETSTGEGWGITFVPERNEFIVTDGSQYLHFWDAETLKEKKEKRMAVKYDNPDGSESREISRLNEVEYVDGYLLSNVWYQDVLLKINIDTGFVEQVYNFQELYVDRAQGADCFNGISVTDKPGELWVTGKQWPHMYRVKLLV